MRQPEACPECERLWREYEHATMHHVKLEGKLKIAAIQHDAEAVAELALTVDAAAHLRELAREALKRHESTHGTRTTSAKAGH